MTLSAETLPDDPETLKAMLIAERIRSERLAQIIKDMNRHRFGRRAEALPADQLLLGLEEAEQNEAEAAAEAEAKSPPMREEAKRKRRANRGSLPSHLPEIETIVDIGSKACPCCGGHLHCIGEEVSKKLDIVPAQFRVLVVRRPKYACRACEDVVIQAPAPARVIEGGMPTEALVAHVLVSKYADHLPLYRQAQIYERQGLHLDRSTLADWVGRAAFLCARSATAFWSFFDLRRNCSPTRRGAGARSRPRANKDRATLGLCERRSALGRRGAAGGRLCLCA